MQRNYLQEQMQGGTFFVIMGILILISVQNTWAFIRTPAFVPNQAIGYSIFLLALYEGGLLFWWVVATRTSDNPTRYIIAWVMFAVSFLAVATAMYYEMNGSTLWFAHAFFAQYAPMVTSNTLFVEMVAVFVYKTVSHETYQHHKYIQRNGHFGKQREQEPKATGRTYVEQGDGETTVPFDLRYENRTLSQTAQLPTSPLLDRMGSAWAVLRGKNQSPQQTNQSRVEKIEEERNEDGQK